MLLMCFSCRLEQCKPVACGTNAVGSFETTMYRKSKKINPRSDLNQSLTLFVYSSLQTSALFEWRRAFQKLVQKRCPAKLKQPAVHMPGGPWSTNLACAFLKQETNVRPAIEALLENLAGIAMARTTIEASFESPAGRVSWFQISCKHNSSLLLL